MTYTPLTWQDSPSTATPITAANLNHIEQGIASANRQYPWPPKTGPARWFQAASNTSGVAPNVGTHYWDQFIVGQDITITAVRFGVTVAAPDTTAIMAIYGDGTDLFANASKIVDITTGVPTTAVGNVEITGLDIALTPGRYWYAFAINGGDVTIKRPNLSSDNAAMARPQTTEGTRGGWYPAGTGLTLPATAPNYTGSFPDTYTGWFAWRIA